MTALTGKLVWLVLILCWGIIRQRYSHRARRHKLVRERDRGYEILLLTLGFIGYLGVPAVYATSSWLAVADYPFQPVMFWAGTAVSIGALYLFWRAHADLGRNFSIKLVIREKHTLITTGVYRLIRHPMYASFLLWSVGQILLLPNWITGVAAIFGFCVVYFCRIQREERLMIDQFGNQYREYMSHTKRLVPYVY
jgi:protein-S-isoprenylcysteine O-methyltransferase Ste14